MVHTKNPALPIGKYLHLLYLYVVGSTASLATCGARRTTFKSWFSPSTWVLWIKLRSWGLVAVSLLLEPSCESTFRLARDGMKTGQQPHLCDTSTATNRCPSVGYRNVENTHSAAFLTVNYIKWNKPDLDKYCIFTFICRIRTFKKLSE